MYIRNLPPIPTQLSPTTIIAVADSDVKPAYKSNVAALEPLCSSPDVLGSLVTAFSSSPIVQELPYDPSDWATLEYNYIFKDVGVEFSLAPGPVTGEGRFAPKASGYYYFSVHCNVYTNAHLWSLGESFEIRLRRSTGEVASTYKWEVPTASVSSQRNTSFGVSGIEYLTYGAGDYYYVECKAVILDLIPLTLVGGVDGEHIFSIYRVA